MDPTEVIRSQADAARGIREDFGPEKAMGYLIGERFLNFLEVGETDRRWRQKKKACGFSQAWEKYPRQDSNL